MTVHVGEEWSALRPVHGGVSQGSILGVLLFNIATDDLEDDCEDAEDPDALSDLEWTQASDDTDDGLDHWWSDPEGDFVASTQTGGTGGDDPHAEESPVLPPGQDPDTFAFCSRPPPRRINYSSEAEVMVPDATSKRNQIWSDELSQVKKYVNDGIQIDKLNYKNPVAYGNEFGENCRSKHITKRAVLRGIVVNAKRT